MRSTCTCASKRTLRSVAVFHNLRMCLSLSKEAYASARIRTRTYVLCDCMQLQRMRAPRPHRHCQIRARWVHHAYGTASAGAALPTCCTSAWACPTVARQRPRPVTDPPLIYSELRCRCMARPQVLLMISRPTSTCSPQPSDYIYYNAIHRYRYHLLHVIDQGHCASAGAASLSDGAALRDRS